MEWGWRVEGWVCPNLDEGALASKANGEERVGPGINWGRSQGLGAGPRIGGGVRVGPIDEGRTRGVVKMWVEPAPRGGAK